MDSDCPWRIHRKTREDVRNRVWNVVTFDVDHNPSIHLKIPDKPSAALPNEQVVDLKNTTSRPESVDSRQDVIPTLAVQGNDERILRLNVLVATLHDAMFDQIPTHIVQGHARPNLKTS